MNEKFSPKTADIIQSMGKIILGQDKRIQLLEQQNSFLHSEVKNLKQNYCSLEVKHSELFGDVLRLRFPFGENPQPPEEKTIKLIAKIGIIMAVFYLVAMIWFIVSFISS